MRSAEDSRERDYLRIARQTERMLTNKKLMQSSSSETESDQHLQLTERVVSTSLSFVEVVARRYFNCCSDYTAQNASALCVHHVDSCTRLRVNHVRFESTIVTNSIKWANCAEVNEIGERFVE